MEKWSILSDVVKYVQYNQYPVGHYELEVKAPEDRYGTKWYTKLQDGEREVKEICFYSNSERLKQDFMDAFKGVKSCVMYKAKYNENSDIRTSHLGTYNMRNKMG